MLFKELIAVCNENRTKPTNTALHIVKVDGTSALDFKWLTACVAYKNEWVTS
jgi:hypothetical protein